MAKTSFNRILSVVLSFMLLILVIPNVDITVNAAYENTHTNTGNQREDIVAVAETQIGYHEGANNETKYNHWLGAISGYPANGYGYPWCHAFVSWCANQAGIPSNIVPWTAGTSVGKSFFVNDDVALWEVSAAYSGNYVPQRGDIIYFGSGSSPSHVGIVTGCDGITVYTIEGNSSDQVIERSYNLNNSYIIAYGVPNYVNSHPSGSNPVGYLDSAAGGEKCVTVTGWAYDADTPEESCEVHIYMDGPAGQGICVATGIIANLASPDVTEILGYPGNHRYEATIPIDATGEHTFFAHAINRGGGDVNSLLEQSFTTTISDIPHGSEMASGVGQTIPDGDYAIFSAIYPDLYLDIYGTDLPATEGTNVIIHTQDVYTLPNAVDCWTVEYLNNGFYKIRQKDSSACLDVTDLSLLCGTNVQICHDNGSAAQQWSIQPTDHGYTIQSRCNSYYLNVYGGYREDLTNVQVWENDDSKAQYFGFIPYGSEADRIIEDGEYRIKLAKNTDFCIDCNGTPESGYSEGTNVTLWDEKQSEDIFQITYVGDGYYTIAEKSTGYVLDIAFGFNDNDESQNYLEKLRNIALYKNYNSRNQKWMIKQNNDGSYSIISQFSGYCLDDYGGYTQNGANISQHYRNESDAQKWIFELVTDDTIQGDCNADGEFNVSDVVLLQKWLLAVPNTHLTNWQTADLCEDGKLDVFDLVMMKRKLING